MEKITMSEIKDVLKEHEIWLAENGKSGTQADFSGKTIKIANFKEAKLSKSIFKNCILKMIEFVDTDLKDANFENAKLKKVDFHNANLIGTNFYGAVFEKVHITEEMYEQIKERLTQEQRKGIITSYKVFMRKMIF